MLQVWKFKCTETEARLTPDHHAGTMPIRLAKCVLCTRMLAFLIEYEGEKIGMAQGLPHQCPRCGAAITPEQRVCRTCGLDFASSPPDYQQGQWGTTPSLPPSSPSGGGQQATPPPMPPQLPQSGAQWGTPPPVSQQSSSSGGGAPQRPSQAGEQLAAPLPQYPSQSGQEAESPTLPTLPVPAAPQQPSQPGTGEWSQMPASAQPPSPSQLPAQIPSQSGGQWRMPFPPQQQPSQPGLGADAAPGSPQPSQPGFSPTGPSTPQPSQPGFSPTGPPTPQQSSQPGMWTGIPTGLPQSSQPGGWAASSLPQQQSFPGIAPTPPPANAAQWNQPPQFVPRPATSTEPQKRTGSKRPVLVIGLVLILLLLAGVGYIGWNVLGLGKPTQSTITTTTLNSTLPYADVDVTVVNIQQAQNFLDDPHSASDGMLRFRLQAQNKATVPVNLAYSTIAHIVFPDGKVEAPAYVKSNVNLAPGAAQTSIVDFTAPQTAKITQLTFRLGDTSEAQVDLPLTGQIDTTRYTPKTVTLNKKIPGSYMGLNWTLVNATSQLSFDGQQASKGMRYVIVTLKVDNTLTQMAVAGSAFDYARLRAGSVTATPKSTTLPVSFDSGAMGKMGTVTFLVPQNTTTLTLMLAPQDQGGFQQTTLDFQL